MKLKDLKQAATPEEIAAKPTTDLVIIIAVGAMHDSRNPSPNLARTFLLAGEELNRRIPIR